MKLVIFDLLVVSSNYDRIIEKIDLLSFASMRESSSTINASNANNVIVQFTGMSEYYCFVASVSDISVYPSTLVIKETIHDNGIINYNSCEPMVSFLELPCGGNCCSNNNDVLIDARSVKEKSLKLLLSSSYSSSNPSLSNDHSSEGVFLSSVRSPDDIVGLLSHLTRQQQENVGLYIDWEILDVPNCNKFNPTSCLARISVPILGTRDSSMNSFAFSLKSTFSQSQEDIAPPPIKSSKTKSNTFGQQPLDVDGSAFDASSVSSAFTVAASSSSSRNVFLTKLSYWLMNTRASKYVIEFINEDDRRLGKDYFFTDKWILCGDRQFDLTSPLNLQRQSHEISQNNDNDDIGGGGKLWWHQTFFTKRLANSHMMEKIFVMRRVLTFTNSQSLTMTQNSHEIILEPLLKVCQTYQMVPLPYNESKSQSIMLEARNYDPEMDLELVLIVRDLNCNNDESSQVSISNPFTVLEVILEADEKKKSSFAATATAARFSGRSVMSFLTSKRLDQSIAKSRIIFEHVITCINSQMIHANVHWGLDESWNTLVMKPYPMEKSCYTSNTENISSSCATSIANLSSSQTCMFCLKMFKWTFVGQKWTAKAICITETDFIMKTIVNSSNENGDSGGMGIGIGAGAGVGAGTGVGVGGLSASSSVSSSVSTSVSTLGTTLSSKITHLSLDSIKFHLNFMDVRHFLVEDMISGKFYLLKCLGEQQEFQSFISVLSCLNVKIIWGFGKMGEGTLDRKNDMTEILIRNKRIVSEFKMYASSLLWLTYRAAFPDLEGFSSDAGWGCMHRTGQCLLAEALRRAKVNDVDVASFFQDDPDAIFSIHNISRTGAEMSVKVGEWFSPSILAHSIARIMEREHRIGIPLRCTVAVDSMLLLDQEKLPLLALIPVRLGMGTTIHELYISTIQTLFKKFPSTFLGIAGGRPRRSYYFYGIQGSEIFYLDPHVTRLYRESLTSQDQEMHCNSINSMDIGDMDPSMLLGFLLSNPKQVDDLVSFTSNQDNSHMFIFSSSIVKSSSNQKNDNLVDDDDVDDDDFY